VLPRRRGRRAVARAAARLLLAATGHAVELDGAEQLPPGPHVIVANHSSIIDPVVLLLALTRPDVRFVAAEDARVLFVSHAFLRRVGTEFIERHDRRRAAEDTDRLLRLVRSGQSLVFFSEGHLEAAPALEPFHLGAFIVATSAQVPVVPVAIVGTRTILAPGRALPRRGAVCVRIGEPLRAVGSGWSATVRLRDSAHEAVAALAR
jgi:1-acyl-sn-glycerol-3-phosphate acyltransferase